MNHLAEKLLFFINLPLCIIIWSIFYLTQYPLLVGFGRHNLLRLTWRF